MTPKLKVTPLIINKNYKKTSQKCVFHKSRGGLALVENSTKKCFFNPSLRDITDLLNIVFNLCLEVGHVHF